MDIGKHIFELGIQRQLLETFPDGREKLHKILYTKFWGCQQAETKLENEHGYLTDILEFLGIFHFIGIF